MKSGRTLILSLSVFSVFACDTSSKFKAVDKVAPIIKGSVPGNDETNVLLSASVTIEFSEQMKTSSVQLASVPFAEFSIASWEFGDSIATFQPTAPLQPSTNYLLTITGADVSNNLLNAQLSFKTISATDACLQANCSNATANTCENGVCRCGVYSACSDPQTCVFENGEYQCKSPLSQCSPACDGNICCFDNACIPSSQQYNKCGTACADCSELGGKADQCVDGVCQCGSEKPCAEGQKCVGGNCYCTQDSCPNGCCSGALGGTCVEPAQQSLSSCGNGPGTECKDYVNSQKADTCTAQGFARCGNTAPCLTDYVCSGGQCTQIPCNAITCADGCCHSGNCIRVDPRPFDKCGADGASCIDLTGRIDSCSGTVGGKCGSSPPCSAGKICEGGTCECPYLSCRTAGTSSCCSQDQTMCKLQTGTNSSSAVFSCQTASDCSNAPNCNGGYQIGCCESASN